MVSGWAFLILSALVLVFGVYIGFLLGQWASSVCVTTRDYWKFNIAGILVILIACLLLAVVLAVAYALGIGLMAGYILGLKMGFGESVGPWKLHDRIFNVNKAQRKTAEEGTGEARRRRRRTGAAAPDLISVGARDSRTAAPSDHGSKPSSKKDAR